MMEQLTPVRSLFEDSKSYDGKTVRVGGWVRNLRASKNFGFINLSDGTYFSEDGQNGRTFFTKNDKISLAFSSR